MILIKVFVFLRKYFFEILIRLPFKSVFRFRCVSKSWLSLISDASFLLSLVSRSKDSLPFAVIFQCDNFRGTHGFISNENSFKNFSSLSPSDQIPGLKIEATSNDLILYRSNGQESVYFVANPFTKQCVRIPIMHRRKSFGYTGLISSAKNGITSYNVVRLLKDRHNAFSDAKLCLNLEMFSSEKGEWRDFKPRNRNCNFNVEVDARPCIEFKGVLHWICNKMTTLLAYDPCSDQCRFISIPNEAYYMNGMNAILGVSCEKLCYFEMSRISIQGYMLPEWILWVLIDHKKGEWRLDQEGRERNIDAFGAACNMLSTYSALFPLAFHPWNKDVVYFWYEGCVLTFNIKEGWFEDEISTFYLGNVVSSWEIFPLLMPLCPTQLPDQNGMTIFAEVKTDTE